MWNRYDRRAYRRQYRGYRHGHHVAWPLIVLAIIFFVFIAHHIWVLFLGIAIAVIIAALLSSRNPFWRQPMGGGYQQPYQQPYQQQNPYYQPGQPPYGQPEQPLYEPYEQGYHAEPLRAEPQPHEPSPSSYEQYDTPQAQYPRERPPQEMPPMEQ
jgi:hypothetical protein